MKLRCLAILLLFFVGFTACYAQDDSSIGLNKLKEFLPAPLEGWKISPVKLGLDLGFGALAVGQLYAGAEEKNKLMEMQVAFSTSPNMLWVKKYNNPEIGDRKVFIKGFPAVESGKESAQGSTGYTLWVNLKNKIEVWIYADGTDYDARNVHNLSDKIDYQGLADLVK